MAHIFISYSRANEQFVQQLSYNLKQKGHHVWIDRQSIKGGEEWSKAIELGIKDSDVMLLACSESTLTSEWVAKEIEWAFSHKTNIIPLRLEDINLPDRVAHLQWVDFSNAAFYEVALNQLFSSLPSEEHRSHIPFYVYWERLEYFTGRDTDLNALHDLMGSGVTGITTGIAGMGGIGKTQLAVEYAYRYRYYYEGGIFWINAARNLTEEIDRIAQLLKTDVRDLYTEHAETSGRIAGLACSVAKIKRGSKIFGHEPKTRE